MTDQLSLCVRHLHINTDLSCILILMISVVYVNPGCKGQEVTMKTPPHITMPIDENSDDTDVTFALPSEDGSEKKLNALRVTAMNLVTDNDVL